MRRDRIDGAGAESKYAEDQGHPIGAQVHGGLREPSSSRFRCVFALFLHCCPFLLPLLRICEHFAAGGLLVKVYFLCIEQYLSKQGLPHELPARFPDFNIALQIFAGIDMLGGQLTPTTFFRNFSL